MLILSVAVILGIFCALLLLFASRDRPRSKSAEVGIGFLLGFFSALAVIIVLSRLQ